ILLLLRGRINCLAAVNRVPAEVLLNVFELVIYSDIIICEAPLLYSKVKRDAVSLSLRVEESPPRLVSTGSLLKLTHVCKRWRDVALSAPTLWTRIDNEQPEQLEAFLKRSRSVPLSLNLSNKHGDTIPATIREHGHRIRRLDITMRVDCRPLPLLPLLDFEAPLLRCLTIRQDQQTALAEHQHPLLFQDKVPNLQALALKCTSWLPANRFPRLTHLYLSFELIPSDGLQHLSTLLRNTPVLENLHVNGLDDAAAQAPISSVIPLPYLSRLTCTDSLMSAAITLLCLLEFPQNVLVRLNDLHCDWPSDASLSQRIPSQAWLSGMTHLEVTSFYDYLKVIADGPCSGLWIQARAADFDEPDTWGPWVANFCAAAPFRSIHALDIRAIEPGSVGSLLRHLPLVTSLSLSRNPYAQDMVDENGRRVLATHIYTALQVDSACCPDLQELVLQPESENLETLAPAALETMARARETKGRPVRRIVITADKSMAPDILIDLKLFETAFGPVAEYVSGETEIRAGVEESSFSMKEMWEVPDAEKWWDLPEEQRASYVFNSQA
ncbi:hypothetical protein FKP32DRAFT_1574310, partial [Trametes sanguinea]